MAKRDAPRPVPLRIPLDFDEAVKALLQTPPPPKEQTKHPKRKPAPKRVKR